jgi:hypothetical protein
MKEVKLARGPQDPEERRRLVKENRIQTLNAARELAVQKRKETAAVRKKENDLRRKERKRFLKSKRCLNSQSERKN